MIYDFYANSCLKFVWNSYQFSFKHDKTFGAIPGNLLPKNFFDGENKRRAVQNLLNSAPLLQSDIL
jgi:hypothetical protein